MFTKTPEMLSLIFIFTVCLVFDSFAQQIEFPNDLGTEIPIVAKIGAKRFRCYSTKNLIVTKQEFEKLLDNKKCSPLKLLEVDFSKHTLINYQVGGDCFMRVKQKVFRNEKTKTYNVQVKNYWGRCRAGSLYQGWIVINKIPEDYKVELKELKLDTTREKENDSFISVLQTPISNKPPITEYIKSEQVDLKGCIQMYRQKQFVIKTKEDYLKKIRKDAQMPNCVKNAENLDFDKFSYIGMQIRSGYCRYPKGLKHKIIQNNSKKEYVLDVSYIDPGIEKCRALSRYDLWVKVPKLPKGYKVVWNISKNLTNTVKN